MPTIWHIFEDCGGLVMARILGWTGALVTQATFDSITYKVFDQDRGRQQTGSGTLELAAVVFDTEQNDGSWPYDDGYNFRVLLPATCFPIGGHNYRAEFYFQPTVGEPFALAASIIAAALHGS